MTNDTDTTDDEAALDKLATIMGVRWPGATWEQGETDGGVRFMAVGAEGGPQIIIEHCPTGSGWQARECDEDFALATGATVGLTVLACGCEIGFQFLTGAAAA